MEEAYTLHTTYIHFIPLTHHCNVDNYASKNTIIIEDYGVVTTSLDEAATAAIP